MPRPPSIARTGARRVPRLSRWVTASNPRKLTLALSLLAASAAHAAERWVPDQYTTIGQAIFACTHGDVVIVRPGVYTGTNNRDISFRGLAITVRSVAPNDPVVVAATIIDCQGSVDNQHRGVWFHNREGVDSVLAGFTIRNGWLYGYGGGILCDAETAPTIRSCVILGCTSAPTASNYFGGGGIACLGSSPVILGCSIVQNSARMGAGVYAQQSYPTLSNCFIARNSAARFGSPWGPSGGGMYVYEGGTTLVNSLIAYNSVTSDQYDNLARGGGIASYRGPLMIYNSLLLGNSLVGASVYGHGGGLSMTFESEARLHNTVLVENSAATGPQMSAVSASTIVVGYCDVQGGQPDVYLSFDSSLLWGPGNIDADPLFLDPDGPDNDPSTWEDNDYRLAPRSPCTAAGDNAAVPADTLDLDGDGDTGEPLPFDLGGNPRFLDDPATDDCRWAPGTCGTAPIVDMGAFEFQPSSCNPCDTTCDGSVNSFDIQPFIDILVGTIVPCAPCTADVNADGSVNGFDIQAFVDCLAR